MLALLALPAVSIPAASVRSGWFPPASNVAFGVVFGLFAAAIVVLAVVTIAWAVRKDRPGREAWRQRMIERRPPTTGIPVDPRRIPDRRNDGTGGIS
jgi:hypothetical protein